MVKSNICLHYYCVLHWKQGIDSIFSFQISLHMWRRWGPYGHTHMGLPSHIPYGSNMGFIWACPSGLAHSHPLWGQYVVYMGMPIWACPVTPHMGPIWGLYGRAHLGLPSCSPYGTHIVVFAGTSQLFLYRNKRIVTMDFLNYSY